MSTIKSIIDIHHAIIIYTINAYMGVQELSVDMRNRSYIPARE